MLVLVNRYNFHKELTNTSEPVIALFWVRWSAECKKIRLQLKELSEQVGSTFKIVTINWEVEKELAFRYEVYGIPTVLVLENGTIIGKYSGVLAIDALKRDFLFQNEYCVEGE